jgi:bacillithiol biosynthesis deacetylase BshB1
VSDVLGIGPHPDDMELAAGGTLALLAAAGYAVTLLDLTAGERATRGTPETRAREAAAAAAILGVQREGLDLPDGGVASTDPRQVEALVDALRRHRPRLVLAMHWADDHPDHREGAELVRRAVYLAGLYNYPAADAGRFRAGRVLYAMGRRAFEPTLIVDVGSVYPVKRRALESYRSQFTRDADDPRTTRISDPGFLARLEARDRLYGGRAGAEFGEPFFEEDPLRVRDPHTLVPESAP